MIQNSDGCNICEFVLLHASLKVAFIFLEVYYLDLEYLASMSETLSTSPNELLTARNSCINLVDARRAVSLRDYLFYTLIEISNY